MYFLMDELSEEEYSLLVAKLTAARLTNAIICNDLWALVDGLSEDWPYNERITVDQYGTPEWFLANAMTDAMSSAGERADAHDQIRRELFDLISY